jgi:alpha-glucosidase (family GH31 glycosyl hydrolase)
MLGYGFGSSQVTTDQKPKQSTFSRGVTMRLPFFKIPNFIVLIILSAVGGLGAVEKCAAEDARPIIKYLSIAREDGHSFKLSRRGTPTVRVTFLAPETFRIRVLSEEMDDAKLPEYMVVKPESSYPAVAVRVNAGRDGVTFRTATVAVRIVIAEGVISADVRTPTKILIENWKIYACCRTARLDLRADEHIYGFGDKRPDLDRRGQRVQMINRDAFASETNQSYKSIPFYMSTAGYGLFFHNFYPATTFDLGVFTKKAIEIQAVGGEMDFYVFVGDLKQILSQYTELTGRPAMLPRWAFGYHQGKASYQGREAFEVAAEMRRRKLPLDVIYYDDWIGEATRKDFIDSLWSRYHVRLTLGFGMPFFGRFGKTDDSALLTKLASHGFLMVDRNNQAVIGPDQYVDAGDDKSSVGYLDYFSSKAVDYVFTEKWERALTNGVILGMVDFGEMDKVPYLPQKYWPSLGMSVAKTRNLFGLIYPLAVVNGAIQRTGGRSTGMVRPGFAGTQRIGWATTGDSRPTYRNFRAHMRGMLSLTLSGFSNVGQDIGGWDSKAPDALYARWFAAGAFFPFMWSHGQDDHEPYSHGKAVENAAREFLNLRYRLVPYLYSLHELAHRTGVPVLRTFALQESEDTSAYRIDDQFFVGDELMVAPIFNDEGDRKVYLPKGVWYDFFGEQQPVSGGREVALKAVSLNRIPVYVRAGAIIPLGPAMQYTAEKPADPLTIHVYGFAAEDLWSEARTSGFSLYEDDGISTAYEQGQFERTALRFRQTRDSVTFEVQSVSGDGNYRSVAQRGYQLHFHGFRGPVARILLNRREIARVSSREAANWTTNESTGDIVITIPPSADRLFEVEFTAEARGR